MAECGHRTREPPARNGDTHTALNQYRISDVGNVLWQSVEA
jgi:hypothetical protein